MTPAVDNSIICAWLELSGCQWPPDHYTLLGIARTEADLAAIERQVQHRLEQVRRHQLLHPEAATEAMNRIAQAFLCLSDSRTRQAYDCGLFGSAAPVTMSVGPSTPTPMPVVLEQPQVVEVDPQFLALVEEEVRAAETAEAAAVQTVVAATVPTEQPAPPPPPPVPPPPPRRGLGTRRAIYQRLLQTRAVLRLWDRAGRFLNQPKRRLCRPAEAKALIEVLTSIRQELEALPRSIGAAGEPGYLVVTLARQSAIVPTFQTLQPSQRLALARDWQAGRTALCDHQRFLRAEARALRRLTRVQRSAWAVRVFLNEHPGGLLVALCLFVLALLLLAWQFVL